jgi:hypothetical protein
MVAIATPRHRGTSFVRNVSLATQPFTLARRRQAVAAVGITIWATRMSSAVGSSARPNLRLRGVRRRAGIESTESSKPVKSTALRAGKSRAPPLDSFRSVVSPLKKGGVMVPASLAGPEEAAERARRVLARHETEVGLKGMSAWKTRDVVHGRNKADRRDRGDTPQVELQRAQERRFELRSELRIVVQALVPLRRLLFELTHVTGSCGLGPIFRQLPRVTKNESVIGDVDPVASTRSGKQRTLLGSKNDDLDMDAVVLPLAAEH